MSRFVLEAARAMWELPVGHRQYLTTGNYTGDAIRHENLSLLVNADSRDFSIYAFPNPEHVPKLHSGTSGLTEHGPWANYPGTIGSIIGKHYPDKPYELVVDGVQAHYKVGPLPLVTASFASSCNEWRMHALRELFRYAAERKLNLNFTELRGKKVREEITQIASEHKGVFKITLNTALNLYVGNTQRSS